MKALTFHVETKSGEQTYTINLPTIGQYADIEATKQILGKGFYNNIVSTNTVSSVNAADMIDIEAHLSILCPDFIKDLKVKSFRDLGFGDYKIIKEAYLKQFVPWWKENIEMLHDLNQNE